ncbi:hypothetical protein NU219Hw_g5653t2 [Hortaea werneckii]
MKKHFETFKTGSSRAMKKVRGKARMISKRICGMREELETQTESQDEGAQAKTERDQVRQERDQVRKELDLRNSFDQEMDEGEPEPAASTARIDTGTFGRPWDFREVVMSMSDAAAAATATTPRHNIGTFGRPSHLPQPTIPTPNAAPAATPITTTTQISSGTFGRPSYPVQVDTPMSDVGTKPTGHNNSKNKNNRQYYKIKRPNSLRRSDRGRTVKQQQTRVSRLPEPDMLMPDASKRTTDPGTHHSSFVTPPPTGPRRGGFNGGQQQQQSLANTQPQGDVAMSDDVKASVDHTDGRCFGFQHPAPPSGPRSGGSGYDVRGQRPSASEPAELDTAMTDASGSVGHGNSLLSRSMPPSGPRVSEFGNRSGKDGEENRPSHAAELDKAMPDATESGSRGTSSLPSSGTSGQAPPQLGVGSRRMETQRRADIETKKLNQSLNQILATRTSSSTESRWKRYRI